MVETFLEEFKSIIFFHSESVYSTYYNCSSEISINITFEFAYDYTKVFNVSYCNRNHWQWKSSFENLYFKVMRQLRNVENRVWVKKNTGFTNKPVLFDKKKGIINYVTFLQVH